MRYEVFDENIIRNDPAYRTQEHMERTYREAVKSSAQETLALNNELSPEFVFCSWKDQSLTFRFRNRPWMLNPGGNMHGGMTASMCDLTMGILARYMKGSIKCVTVHLGVDYMRQIPSGDNVIVEAKVEKEGKKVFFMSARVYRVSDGKLSATANATFM